MLFISTSLGFIKLFSFLFLFRQKKKQKKAPEIDDSPISVGSLIGLFYSCGLDCGSLVQCFLSFRFFYYAISRLSYMVCCGLGSLLFLFLFRQKKKEKKATRNR